MFSGTQCRNSKTNAEIVKQTNKQTKNPRRL